LFKKQVSSAPWTAASGAKYGKMEAAPERGLFDHEEEKGMNGSYAKTIRKGNKPVGGDIYYEP